jgi:alpha-D-xyloside xylohydrolase
VWGVIVFLTLTLALARDAAAQWIPLNPVSSVQKQDDGVDFTMHSGTLRIQVCSDAIIHVLYSPTASFPNTPQYAVTKTSWARAQWTVQATDKDVTIATPLMKITVTRADGSILYDDATGKKLFKDYTRTLTAVQVNGEQTYHS